MKVLGRGFAALLLIIPLLACAQTAPPAFQEGVHYQLVSPPQPTDSGDKIEVLELFWYGCPHCFHLEPVVAEWLKHKPANVTFTRMPVTLNPSWELLARAYYVAEDLGVLDKTHGPLFAAIHTQHINLNTDDDVIAFFKTQGLAEADVRNAMASFSVETKMRRAKQMGERYGITGVPAIIVNGKYRVTGSLAGSNENIIKVVDFLVRKENAPAPAR